MEKKSDFCGHQFGVQKPQQKTGLATESLPSSRACADIHACRAWRTIARGAAKSWKPSREPAETIEACTIFCPAAKILPTKRPPFWGPFLDPKTGAKSPGHKQIKLRLLDPKTGVVLSAKLLSPSEKKHKFRLFLHVRDRSFPYRWVSRALQRRECLFSTPCEHLCPHMFLNWGGPPWRHRFCLCFWTPNEGHKFTRKCNLTLDTSMAKPTPRAFVKNG